MRKALAIALALCLPLVMQGQAVHLHSIVLRPGDSYSSSTEWRFYAR